MTLDDRDTGDRGDFDTGPPRPSPPSDTPDAMILDLEGFEGPLDILLALARTQKVDLLSISILQLAEQYLAFINRAREISLELAADYLVMAAWLAYLKSRLLLPPEPGDDEPSGEEMAARLAFRLQRLEAMREAGGRLMNRDRLGRDVFARGRPEGVQVIVRSEYRLSVYELLKAYGESRSRNVRAGPMHIKRATMHTIEEALERLERLLGTMPDWSVLEKFLPLTSGEVATFRSGVASTFVALLEMVRRGKAEVEQADAFGPIYVRGNAAAQSREDGV